MARIVKGGLIRTGLTHPGTADPRVIKKAMKRLEQAGKQGVQALGRQEIFYGPYFCDPRGPFPSMGGRHQDELVAADLDPDQIREVRNVWPFFRDRRPETYGALTAP